MKRTLVIFALMMGIFLLGNITKVEAKEITEEELFNQTSGISTRGVTTTLTLKANTSYKVKNNTGVIHRIEYQGEYGIDKYDYVKFASDTIYTSYRDNGGTYLSPGDEVTMNLREGNVRIVVPGEISDTITEVNHKALFEISTTPNDYVEFSNKYQKKVLVKSINGDNASATQNGILIRLSGTKCFEATSESFTYLGADWNYRFSSKQGTTKHYIPYECKDGIVKYGNTPAYKSKLLKAGDIIELDGRTTAIGIGRYDWSKPINASCDRFTEMDGIINSLAYEDNTFGFQIAEKGMIGRLHVKSGELEIYYLYEMDGQIRNTYEPLFKIITLNQGETLEVVNEGGKYLSALYQYPVEGYNFNIVEYDKDMNVVKINKNAEYYHSNWNFVGVKNITNVKHNPLTYKIPLPEQKKIYKVDKPALTTYELTINDNLKMDYVKGMNLNHNLKGNSKIKYDLVKYDKGENCTFMDRNLSGDFNIATDERVHLTVQSKDPIIIDVPSKYSDKVQKVNEKAITSMIILRDNMLEWNASNIKTKLLDGSYTKSVIYKTGFDSKGNVEFFEQNYVKDGFTGNRVQLSTTGNGVTIAYPTFHGKYYKLNNYPGVTLKNYAPKDIARVGMETTENKTIKFKVSPLNSTSYVKTYDKDGKVKNENSSSHFKTLLPQEKLVACDSIGTTGIDIVYPTDLQKYFTIAEDVNNDKTVDVVDLSRMVQGYNSKGGNTNYNVNFDINNDMIIDIYDLVYVAKKFK
ncbi:MAG: hypothetical protein ACRC7N_19475 [Clostridium sp.]